MADLIGEDLYKSRQMPTTSSAAVITHLWKEENDFFVKKVMKYLMKQENLLVCFINEVPGKYQWSIGCSESLAFPFNEIKDQLLPIINGKGGGRHPYGKEQEPQP